MNKRFYALGRMKKGRMNNTEFEYSKKLELMKQSGEILWYSFEAITLKLADDTRYTPDFVVMDRDGVLELHEVKGSPFVFRDDAKVKVKVCAEKFPFRMLVVYPEKGGGWKRVEY